MLVKLLILLGAVCALAMFLFKAARGAAGDDRSARGGQPAKKRRRPVKDLVKCAKCGVFLPADQTCDCRDKA